MANAKELMVVDLFEATQTIFVDSKHLGSDELCEGLVSIAGVTSAACEGYRLVVMYGQAFSIQEVAPSVIAMLCTAIGTKVDAVELTPGLTFDRNPQESLDWLRDSASRIQKRMTRDSLRHIIAICDEELEAHAAASKQLRATKSRAKRQLTKLS